MPAGRRATPGFRAEAASGAAMAGKVGYRARVIDWLREHARRAERIVSVCSGALLLAEAGLLDGRRATSHWLALDGLAAFGAEPTGERVVVVGKFITAAGVSSGIDMGPTLVGRVAGDEQAQGVQLGTEYGPRPPYDAGSPQKAPAEIVEESSAPGAGSSSGRRGQSQVEQALGGLHDLGLDPLGVLRQQVPLVGRGIPAARPVRQVGAHVPDTHPDRPQAGQHLRRVEVPAAVPAVPAALVAADRPDKADILAIPQCGLTEPAIPETFWIV